MDATIKFANYAAKQLRTYETPMYDLFADICDKVIAGDRDAISVVEPIVRNTQMDIFRKQEQLYISYWEDNDEYREVCEVMDAYIDDITGDDCEKQMGFEYHFPKKFFDEVFMYFSYNDEGKKCMKEFEPNNGKVEEITNMLH